MSLELALKSNIQNNFRKVLEKLQAGNSRFMMGMRVGDITTTRREELLLAQHPSTTILTCSDSRVVPAFIFDQGLGDLFVVRNAGNVIDPITMGSLEYSCECLGTSLLLILGHTRCEAVSSACKGGEVPGYMKDVIKILHPVVESCKGFEKEDSEKLIKRVIRKNVEINVEFLKKKSEVLQHLVSKGQLYILGGIYHMETGNVEFFY